MNLMFRQTLQALCLVVMTAMLSACGSGKTTDPLVAKRVIGLGDAYNDVGYGGVNTRFTVRPLVTPTAGSSVVEQLAALLGAGNAGTAVTASTTLPSTGVFSYAQGDSLVLSGANTLADQVGRAIADVGGGFGVNDVVVITAGAGDLRAGSSPETIANSVASSVGTLLAANAQYVVVMLPIDVAKTPGGQGLAANQATSSYVGFLGVAVRDLTRTKSRNPVVLMDPALSFNLLSASNSGFSDNTSGVVPGSVAGYCGPGVTAGCAEVANQTPLYSAMFFADDRNLTPAGNNWVAGLLYNATGTASWR